MMHFHHCPVDNSRKDVESCWLCDEDGLNPLTGDMAYERRMFATRLETGNERAAFFVLINGEQSSGNVVTLRPNLSVVRATHNT